LKALAQCGQMISCISMGLPPLFEFACANLDQLPAPQAFAIQKWPQRPL
jgi:hypothetical protein